LRATSIGAFVLRNVVFWVVAKRLDLGSHYLGIQRSPILDSIAHVCVDVGELV
jgi:hypothetical protein